MRNRIRLFFVGMLFATSTLAVPPAVPTLYISTDGPKAHLYWNEISGADRYTIFATNLADGSFFGQFDMGSNSRVGTILPEGSVFFVSVRAENSDGNSAFSGPRKLVISSDSVTPSVEQVIQNYARNVIYNTYSDLAARAEILYASVIELRFDTTDTILSITQDKWRDARRAWEQSEAFLFGPVDTEGLDPALDSWPINATDLQNFLAGTDPVIEETIDAFDGTLKGFHAIEFILFGNGNSKTATELTARELDFLGAVADVLAKDTKTLAELWNPNGGNFLTEFAQAGAGSSTFTSQTAALQEMINGMIGIADELGNTKLSDPLTNDSITLVESQFSFNSRADFMDNIRSIRNVYTGNYLLSEGPGLNALVKSFNPVLDETINSQIDAAISAIHAIPQPFTEAISSSTAEIQVAINAVNALQATLENQLMALVP